MYGAIFTNVYSGDKFPVSPIEEWMPSDFEDSHTCQPFGSVRSPVGSTRPHAMPLCATLSWAYVEGGGVISDFLSIGLSVKTHIPEDFYNWPLPICSSKELDTTGLLGGGRGRDIPRTQGFGGMHAPAVEYRESYNLFSNKFAFDFRANTGLLVFLFQARKVAWIWGMPKGYISWLMKILAAFPFTSSRIKALRACRWISHK